MSTTPAVSEKKEKPRKLSPAHVSVIAIHPTHRPTLARVYTKGRDITEAVGALFGFGRVESADTKSLDATFNGDIFDIDGNGWTFDRKLHTILAPYMDRGGSRPNYVARYFGITLSDGAREELQVFRTNGIDSRVIHGTVYVVVDTSVAKDLCDHFTGLYTKLSGFNARDEPLRKLPKMRRPRHFFMSHYFESHPDEEPKTAMKKCHQAWITLSDAEREPFVQQAQNYASRAELERRQFFDSYPKKPIPPQSVRRMFAAEKHKYPAGTKWSDLPQSARDAMQVEFQKQHDAWTNRKTVWYEKWYERGVDPDHHPYFAAKGKRDPCTVYPLFDVSTAEEHGTPAGRGGTKRKRQRASSSAGGVSMTKSAADDDNDEDGETIPADDDKGAKRSASKAKTKKKTKTKTKKARVE